MEQVAPSQTRSRHFAGAGLLSVLLIVAAASPVAARPDSGIRFILTYASTNLTAIGLWDCDGQDAAGATLRFGYVDGKNLQAPIGNGKPSVWTDMDPLLEVFGCDGDYWAFSAKSYDLTGQFDASVMSIDTFESATLHVSVPMFDDNFVDTGVRISFALDWTAVGEPVVMNWHEGGTFHEERSAPAVVSGTVVVSGLDQLWHESLIGDSLTFDPVNNTDQTAIGWASNIDTP
jgi:hypothetical protein